MTRAALTHPLVWYFLALLAIAVLLVACSGYNPSLYPSYDVLNPGPEVRLNPKAFTPDGDFIVNTAFIAWVEELKQEIIKLRKAIK